MPPPFPRPSPLCTPTSLQGGGRAARGARRGARLCSLARAAGRRVSGGAGGARREGGWRSGARAAAMSGAELVVLQGACKRDPDAYREEFELQLAHYRSKAQLLRLQPEGAC